MGGRPDIVIFSSFSPVVISFSIADNPTGTSVGHGFKEPLTFVSGVFTYIDVIHVL